MRFLVAAVLLVVACGFQPVGENGGATQNSSLGGGAGPDPGDPGSKPPAPADPWGGPGTKPGEPPPPDGFCTQLEEKVTCCKTNGIDCPEAFRELEVCSAGTGGPPPASSPCDSLAGLFKSCTLSHPGDALCDEILVVWKQCEAP